MKLQGLHEIRTDSILNHWARNPVAYEFELGNNIEALIDGADDRDYDKCRCGRKLYGRHCTCKQ